VLIKKVEKAIDDVFLALEKINPEAGFLSEQTLSAVTEWIDTGCMVLNAIISGSLFGGVPKGRITGFSGPSMTGKTYIINKILGNAQKKGMIPVIFDTEVAVDSKSAKSVGLDPEKAKYVPVDTVENCRNQIFKMLETIENKPELKGKFIISIDSLGNLSAQKELNDAAADKSANDMGLRAKQLKSMMRTLTYKAAKTGTTILFSNHTYEDPAAMYPSLVKQQSGGKGPVYLASVLVQLAAKYEKQDLSNDKDQMLGNAKSYSGVTLRALTVKNRFVPQFLQAEMYLNFLTGLNKYSGIKELAVDNGMIVQTGSTYQLADGTKLGYFKTFKDDKEFWDEKIIPAIEEAITSKWKYGNDTEDKVESLMGETSEDEDE